MWDAHISTIVNKSNIILGILKRAFVSRDPDLWREIYVSLVRPHLEYAEQAWNPLLVGDIKRIFKVHRDVEYYRDA